MKLEADIITTLKILDTFFRSKGIKYALIGAQVPRLLITFPVLDEHRPTRDIDVTLQLEDWSDYDKIKKELMKIGFQEDKFELRFIYEKTILDIVPYLQNEIKSGILHLPHSETSMNLSGFDTTIPFNINYEARGAYLLGIDLKEYLTANERKSVSVFFDYFHDEYSAFLQKLAQYDRQKRKELLLMFTCFNRGIQS